MVASRKCTMFKNSANVEKGGEIVLFSNKLSSYGSAYTEQHLTVSSGCISYNLFKKSSVQTFFAEKNAEFKTLSLKSFSFF